MKIIIENENWIVEVESENRYEVTITDATNSKNPIICSIGQARDLIDSLERTLRMTGDKK